MHVSGFLQSQTLQILRLLVMLATCRTVDVLLMWLSPNLFPRDNLKMLPPWH